MLKIVFYKSVILLSDYFFCRVMGFKGKVFNYFIDICRFLEWIINYGIFVIWCCKFSLFYWLIFLLMIGMVSRI